MPEPSVEPMPEPPSELRFSVPLEAHEASYLAASARIASLRSSSMGPRRERPRGQRRLYEYTVVHRPRPARGLRSGTLEDEARLLARRRILAGRLVRRPHVH